MAGKLTIRRVGNFLPLLCLVGLLLVIFIFIWLSTVGIPGCALRYLEEEAARQGIPVQIKSIQFVPRAGLAIKAEGVHLDIPQKGAPAATIHLKKAQFSFSLAGLLEGDFMPHDIHIRRGRIEIPTGQHKEDTLTLKDIDLYAELQKRGKGIHLTSSAILNSVALKGRAAIIYKNGFPALQSTSGTQEQNVEPLAFIAEHLSTISPYLRQVNEQINAQSWNREKHPVLNFNLLGGDEWKCQFQADIPSYDISNYQIRDISVDANFANQAINVNKLQFRTINPDTAVSLQAAYSLNTRELEFNTRSSAPLIRMVDSYLGEQSTPLLRKIQSEGNATPRIELDGKVCFAEDYALNNITLRGKIDHKSMKLGDVPVRHLLLTFYLRDSNFNIDNLLLELEDGHIRANARAANGSGSASVDVAASAEDILGLARCFSGNEQIQLPDNLQLPHQLHLLAQCGMQIPAFEPGKSRLNDLIPTLQSCKIQFHTDSLSLSGTSIEKPNLSLLADGIDLEAPKLSIGALKVQSTVAASDTEEAQAALKNLELNADVQGLDINLEQHTICTASTHLNVGVDALRQATASLEKLQFSADIQQFFTNYESPSDCLNTQSIQASLQAGGIEYEQLQNKGLRIKLNLPEGFDITREWKNLQKGTQLHAEAKEFIYGAEFNAQDVNLQLLQTGTEKTRLTLVGSIGEKKLELSTTLTQAHSNLLLFNDIRAQVPLASFAPLMGGEPLQELKLPKDIFLQGNVLLQSDTNRIVNAHYTIQVPELVRVCQNVHVIKGKEIPLALTIRGEFNTSEQGEMHYDADVVAKHELGVLDIHASGDPLKNCHITGTNTIPVDVINALIDNVDAHWIMRDFRCTPGVTRNDISDINTTIRYDKGFYLHALCKAHLQNMEFMLGAIRDVKDSEGKPTGEEYLRKDLSPNPYTLVKDGRCNVEVLVQLDCTNDKGEALPERIRINLTNPDLLYDNKPWLKRMGFKKGAPTGRIYGEAVRFNIENNTISLHKLKGKAYPAYSIGMYYAPIQHYMEDIILRDPVDIETDYCIFPLSRNCDVPMQGIIRADAATGAGFKFLGTTIPFTNFSGFINISDEDVYLDRMNAECWGGIMKGALRIGFSGKHTSLDGYIQAHNMNLKDIVASYGEEFTPATCKGFIRFQAPKPELDAVRAYGQVSLKDGDLMQISLFRPLNNLLSDMPGHLAKLQKMAIGNNEAEEQPGWVTRLINNVFDRGNDALNSTSNVPFANHFLKYGISEAFSRFDIRDGHLITRSMKAKGYNLNVGVHLDINLDDLTFKGDLWPKISSVPTALISPVTILSKFLIDINLYGDLLNPKWEFGLSKKFKSDEESLSPEPAPEEDVEKD